MPEDYARLCEEHEGGTESRGTATTARRGRGWYGFSAGGGGGVSAGGPVVSQIGRQSKWRVQDRSSGDRWWAVSSESRSVGAPSERGGGGWEAGVDRTGLDGVPSQIACSRWGFRVGGCDCDGSTREQVVFLWGGGRFFFVFVPLAPKFCWGEPPRQAQQQQTALVRWRRKTRPAGAEGKAGQSGRKVGVFFSAGETSEAPGGIWETGGGGVGERPAAGSRAYRYVEICGCVKIKCLRDGPLCADASVGVGICGVLAATAGAQMVYICA